MVLLYSDFVESPKAAEFFLNLLQRAAPRNKEGVSDFVSP